MKVTFENDGLEILYQASAKDMRGKQQFSVDVVRQYQRKVDLLVSASSITELRSIRSLNFEALKGDRKGQYSVRINIQYRLLFRINKDREIEIIIIEISKHYE
jgi:proteic killer suppression protein